MTVDRSSLLLIVLLVFLSGCGGSKATPTLMGSQDTALQITSTAFDDGGVIPTKYTCDGSDISPPIVWSGTPESTQSLVLIMDDPDAPAGTWIHWLVYDLPQSLTSLDEGAFSSPALNTPGVQGQNSFQNSSYGGPCPPGNKPHRYFIKLYALDQMLNLPPNSTKSQVEKAMQGHILAQGQLVGLYNR